MQSVNFEFIRPYQPEIADLGGFAEYHLYADPSSSLVKLRTLAEQAVKSIYFQERLPKLFRPQLIDLINDASFQEVANKTLIHNLNYLRIQGNGPAHGDPYRSYFTRCCSTNRRLSCCALLRAR